MLKLFDFRCPDGHVEEHLVNGEADTVRCTCGLEATRMITGTRTKLDPISGDFPGATIKWAREHERRGGPSSP